MWITDKQWILFQSKYFPSDAWAIMLVSKAALTKHPRLCCLSNRDLSSDSSRVPGGRGQSVISLGSLWGFCASSLAFGSPRRSLLSLHHPSCPCCSPAVCLYAHSPLRKDPSHKGLGLPRWQSGKDYTYEWRRHRRCRQVRALCQKDIMERETAAHSSLLAWRIPWIKEPGGLQSIRSQSVGHEWLNSILLD